MHNWSTTTTELKKDPKKYRIWKLEQTINFGLNKTKINKNELKKHWNELTIDASRKKFLHLLLWPRKKQS